MNTLDLPYTICFLTCKGRILMVLRSKKPNQYLWNGLGGKIAEAEMPRASVKREMHEETGKDISLLNTFYCGIVTWNKNNEETTRGGMYAFVVSVPELWITEEEIQTPEGILAWKDSTWATDTSNSEVVSNIPHFLPPMLRKEKPKEYRCHYKNHQLITITTHSLPQELMNI